MERRPAPTRRTGAGGRARAFNVVLFSRRALGAPAAAASRGAEGSSRVLQVALETLYQRMRGAEHAGRAPSSSVVTAHAEVVERGIVLVECPRVVDLILSESITLSEYA